MGNGLLGTLTAGRGDSVARAGARLAGDAASRLERAKDMAFHTEMPPYHGTAQDIRAFDPSLGGATSGSQAARLGVFAARDPDTASEFATYAAARGKGGSPDALPLLHRAERPAVLSLRGDELDREISATLDYAWDDGYDAVLLKNYTTPAPAANGQRRSWGKFGGWMIGNILKIRWVNCSSPLLHHSFLIH